VRAQRYDDATASLVSRLAADTLGRATTRDSTNNRCEREPRSAKAQYPRLPIELLTVTKDGCVLVPLV
jgi:hypothetical protein